MFDSLFYRRGYLIVFLINYICTWLKSANDVSGIDFCTEMPSTPSYPHWSCDPSPSLASRDVLFLLLAFLHATISKYEWFLAIPLFLRGSVLTIYTILHPFFSHLSLNLDSLRRVSVPTSPTSFATVDHML